MVFRASKDGDHWVLRVVHFVFKASNIDDRHFVNVVIDCTLAFIFVRRYE